MARVSGPLMSVDASGTFAGKLVYAKWKGLQYCRNHVVPANPMTINQVTNRNAVRVCGAAQHWVKHSAQKRNGQTLTDLDILIAAAPAGMAWNSELTKAMIGSGSVHYLAAAAAWTALDGGVKANWESAAGALSPPILDVAQKGALNVSATAITAGRVLYHDQYGLFVLGLLPTVPSAAPTYA